jgi:DNA polymerase V
LIRAAKALADKLFVEGRPYKKAGIVLSALEPADTAQSDFFDDGSAEKSTRLSQTVDRLNASLGMGSLRYGGEKSSTAWGSRCESQSPCWTTRWEDLKTVRVAV